MKKKHFKRAFMNQKIKGKNNVQTRDLKQSEQSLGNVTESKVTGANINGNNISINELPCEILLLLIKIIQQLINERKGLLFKN